MFFPIFVDVENKEILIIGGGKTGTRKAQTLKEYGAKITVYSEKVTEEELLKDKDIKTVNQNVSHNEDEIKGLVKNYFMVVAATDDIELNNKIAHICMNENILVNNVSSKTEMNSMFAAIVKNDEFQIAVSTNGVNCRRSRAMKSRVQKVLDEVENLGK